MESITPISVLFWWVIKNLNSEKRSAVIHTWTEEWRHVNKRACEFLVMHRIEREREAYPWSLPKSSVKG